MKGCGILNAGFKGMKRQFQKAFTLVEIMIVVAIIGLLAAIGVPSMLKSGRKARANRFIHEIQAAGHAFVQYASENATYPSDKNPTQMPDGMAPYLARFPWTEDTVIGGQWDWDYEQFGVLAGVSVYRPKWDDALMQEVDAAFDDGNLNTGQFRKRLAGYIYIIEE